MTAIDDLIAQIEDPTLRERIAREVGELQRSRKFGLVFEQHLPELLPVCSAKPRRGDYIAKRGVGIRGGKAIAGCGSQRNRDIAICGHLVDGEGEFLAPGNWVHVIGRG